MHCCRIINVCIVLARAFLFLLLLSPFLSLSPLLFNRSLNLLIHCELDKYCLHLKWNDVFPSSIIYLSILHFQTSNSLRLKNISHRKEKKKIEDWTLKGNRFFGWLFHVQQVHFHQYTRLKMFQIKNAFFSLRLKWFSVKIAIGYTVYRIHFTFEKHLEWIWLNGKSFPLDYAS